MKAIVLSFDRLALRILGCYGNAWIDTPHFDRLAAEGVVFDAHFGEHFEPAGHHAWFTGRYQCRPSPNERNARTGLGEILRRAGVEARLIVEEGADDPCWESAGFADVLRVSGRDGLEVDDDETPFAQLVAAAAACLDEWAERDVETGLLWLKSRGVPRPWTAPREFAAEYVGLFEDDEDEPGERSGVSPPVIDETDGPAIPDEAADEDFTEPIDDEPIEEANAARAAELEQEAEEFDELLRALGRAGEGDPSRLTPDDWKLARAVYAGYVSLLDTWFGELREVVAELEEDVLWIVTAAQGECLGERVGLAAEGTPLSEEWAHLPLIVHLPGGEGGSRRQDLVQTVDLAPTLCDFFGVATDALAADGASLLPTVARHEPSIRDAAYLASDGWQGIRTPDLYLLRRSAADLSTAPPPDDHQRPRLYARPDDVWEIHDVAAQSPADVEELAARLDRFFVAEQRPPGERPA
ncbi:MAG: sulfatase-like hydrolase/transferase [Planctomycetales bacterium]